MKYRIQRRFVFRFLSQFSASVYLPWQLKALVWTFSYIYSSIFAAFHLQIVSQKTIKMTGMVSIRHRFPSSRCSSVSLWNVQLHLISWTLSASLCFFYAWWFQCEDNVSWIQNQNSGFPASLLILNSKMTVVCLVH